MAEVKWPFGAAASEAMTATGDQEFTIDNDLTFIDGVSVVATGNRTLKLTAASGLTAGARVVIHSKTTATETLVFSTGCTAPTITGVAGKTFGVELVYNGTSFMGVATAKQLD